MYWMKENYEEVREAMKVAFNSVQSESTFS
jgi:hypothetical protein